ncbi:MAG: uroporphyrinogen decarboxylase family protein [Sedimentisphaeraceae bacterium JB056]
MTSRDKFIDYVKNGGDEPFVSLQIGAGAGFDTKLAGKLWNSETTVDDTIEAYQKVECEPLINIGLPDAGEFNHALKREWKTVFSEHERIMEAQIESPYGLLHWKNHELPKQGIVPLDYPLTFNDGEKAFDIVRWYADNYGKVACELGRELAPQIDHIHEYAPVSVQWNMQPFELFGLMTVDNLVMFSMLYPELYRKCCDHILEVNLEIVDKVFEAGADFVFLGGPGSEMLSPQLYEDFLIPDSKVLTDHIHAIGGLVYTHICSPIQPFLDMGLYNRMGIDLFETLSPPPVGNVESLQKAREILPEKICTRGNVGLDVLLDGSVDDVKEKTIEVLEATKGFKHMVAASDYLFYDIPFENVKAMVETVRNFK